MHTERGEKSVAKSNPGKVAPTQEADVQVPVTALCCKERITTLVSLSNKGVYYKATKQLMESMIRTREQGLANGLEGGGRE